MNKEIESVIFSNVGNRLTQELAIGLVMSLAQVVQQAMQAERQAVADVIASASESDVPAMSSAAGADDGVPAAIIDPAYQRKRFPVKQPRATTKPKTTKARR